MNKQTTFYLVRHAESEANILNEFGGNPALSLNGKKQAQKRAKELSGIHFDTAFSSDLTRAQQTAGIIAKEHKLAVKAMQTLRERNYGQLEGVRMDAKIWTEELRVPFETWYNKEYKERLKEKAIAGMESDEEMITRTTTFLREVATTHLGKTVLIVTHADLMQTFLVHLGHGRHKEYAMKAIKNTGYCIICFDGADFSVQGVKDIDLITNE